MKIATFNVNSVKARANTLFLWLKAYNPDIVFLQEIKCETENFLFFESESLGYKVAALGQKSYNGVAVLCKYNFEVTSRNLPQFADDTAMRYLEILVTKEKEKFYAATVYAPNGCSPDKSVEKEKLNYKLHWFDMFYQRIFFLKNTGRPVIIGGDFNVIMENIDVYDEKRFVNTPLYIKDVKDKIKAIEFIGMHDAFRLLHPSTEGYTFWDYSGNAFVTNSGLRIDYLFISASFAERLKLCQPDKTPRMMDKPSDHTALIAEFDE